MKSDLKSDYGSDVGADHMNQFYTPLFQGQYYITTRIYAATKIGAYE